MTPLELLAVGAFCLLLAALLATGLILTRRPSESKTREERMSPEARATDEIIAREIEESERGRDHE